MSIKAICKTNVASIERGATLSAVSQLMQQRHVGSIVVTETLDGKKIPCGIITDRDIALVLGSSSKPQEVRVENIMQSQPITAKYSDGIFEVVLKMRENGIKRLPVLSKDGSLFGIVCADDLLSVMAKEINNLARITESQVRREEGINLPVEKHIQI